MKQTFIRAVVFDVDGVLVDSAPCHTLAFEQILRPYGIKGFDYSAYAGWRTDDVVETILARAGIKLSTAAISKLSQKKSQIARELLSKTNALFSESVSLLRRLSSDYILAVASSGSRESVEAFLDMSGCRELFRSALSGVEVNRAKPDPEIYVKTFERLKLHATECAIVEDAVAGIRAGKAAGAVVIGIVGTCSRPMLRDAGADYVIDSLPELATLLSSMITRPAQITCENWSEFASSRVEPSLWTVIVPAAGRGSRLGFNRPKILFPVAGRMILEWLLDLCLPNCASVVFVLGPAGRSDVECELEHLAPGRYRIAVQDDPTGMGDAVDCGLPVSTEFVAVIWGDQVALRRRSVEACLRLHQGPLRPAITCPTVFRANPYIHFDRDALGRLTGVRQAREGDAMPPQGESDTGFFCFRAHVLSELLSRTRVDKTTRGYQTGEFNLLPVIPAAAQLGHVVLTPHVVTLEETFGVNSKADAARVEAFLQNVHD